MVPDRRPIRTCVACRKRQDPWHLVRFARTREGAVTASVHPPTGRGAYLCPKAACFERAQKRGALGRALRVRGALPPLEALASQALAALEARVTRLETSGGRAEELAARRAVRAALASLLGSPEIRAEAVDGMTGVGKVAHRAHGMVGAKGGPANAHG